MYLIATFRSPSANLIRHMVTWRWRWARDQNTVIGRWKVIGPRISVQRPIILGCVIWIWLSYLIQPDEHLQTYMTSGQSNLTKGRMATAHARYSTYFTMGCPFPHQNYPSHGGIGLSSNTRFLGTTRVHNQRASWSVQPFLQGSRSRQTDRPTHRLVSWSLTSLFSKNMAISETIRQTDRATVYNNRLQCIYTCPMMWPHNIYHMSNCEVSIMIQLLTDGTHCFTSSKHNVVSAMGLQCTGYMFHFTVMKWPKLRKSLANTDCCC